MRFSHPHNGLGKNRKTSIPLYVRIESLVRNRILNGQLQPGEKLPTEEDLVKQFGVSQITIRNALSNLERDGLIVRNRPKGTFVAENVPVRKKFVITNEVYNILEDADRYEVKGVDLKTMYIGETRNPRAIKEFFHLTSEDQICVVRRTRLLKGIPMYYIENILSPSIAQHLTLKDLSEKHLLKILKEKIGITIDRGEMYIEAVPADPDVAETLRMQIFEPLILRQLYYWFPTGEPFEIVNSYMRPDYFRYKVDVDVRSF
jgi:GntR family transcriptional regulator